MRPSDTCGTSVRRGPRERLLSVGRTLKVPTARRTLPAPALEPILPMQRSTAFRLAIPALLLSVATTAAGAQQPAFDLSVKSIMRGPELYGREPAQVRFTADGQWIYFRWLPPGSPWDANLKPYRVAARAGAAPELVTDAHMDSIAPMLATGPRTRNGQSTVVSANGDLWLRTNARPTMRLRRITQTNATESDPKFSLDEREVYFIRDNNAFAFDLATGLTRQLTDIRSGAAPKDPEPPKGQRAALAEQQKELLQVIRDGIRADSIQKADRAERDARGLPVVWIPTTDRIGALSLSPDGKSALLSTFTPATGAKGSDVPDYVNEDGYPRMIPGRTKVGDAQGTQKVGHLDLASGKVTWLELTPDKKAAGGASVRDWSDDGRFALVFVTSADFKNRYLWSVASAGGAMQMVDELRDEAWVNGPCFGCTGWTPQGRAWFVSEATGYAQLYSANADGSDRKALTSGNWEVLQVDRAADDVNFDLLTSEPSPFTKQGYRMAMTGGPRTRVTTGDGGHDPVIAPRRRDDRDGLLHREHAARTLPHPRRLGDDEPAHHLDHGRVPLVRVEGAADRDDRRRGRHQGPGAALPPRDSWARARTAPP